AARVPENHRYPESEGLDRFRQAVADWYQRRFGVELSAAREVLTLIGAKEGIGHLPLALVNPGDLVLIPDPAYPVYRAGTIFAGGVPYLMPLRRESGFLPDLTAIPDEVRRRARLMFLNYPNNPTGAVATIDFYREVVEFATRNRIVVAQDNTYSEISFDDYRAPSFLQVPGAKDVGIEFHSLSKTFNMTGWRIAFAVGNPELIAGLGKVKTNIDSGPLLAVQEAAEYCLANAEALADPIRQVYADRRGLTLAG